MHYSNPHDARAMYHVRSETVDHYFHDTPELKLHLGPILDKYKPGQAFSGLDHEFITALFTCYHPKKRWFRDPKRQLDSVCIVVLGNRMRLQFKDTKGHVLIASPFECYRDAHYLEREEERWAQRPSYPVTRESDPDSPTNAPEVLCGAVAAPGESEEFGTTLLESKPVNYLTLALLFLHHHRIHLGSGPQATEAVPMYVCSMDTGRWYVYDRIALRYLPIPTPELLARVQKFFAVYGEGSKPSDLQSAESVLSILASFENVAVPSFGTREPMISEEERGVLNPKQLQERAWVLLCSEVHSSIDGYRV